MTAIVCHRAVNVTSDWQIIRTCFRQLWNFQQFEQLKNDNREIKCSKVFLNIFFFKNHVHDPFFCSCAPHPEELWY